MNCIFPTALEPLLFLLHAKPSVAKGIVWHTGTAGLAADHSSLWIWWVCIRQNKNEAKALYTLGGLDTKQQLTMTKVGRYKNESNALYLPCAPYRCPRTHGQSCSTCKHMCCWVGTQQQRQSLLSAGKAASALLIVLLLVTKLLLLWSSS